MMILIILLAYQLGKMYKSKRLTRITDIERNLEQKVDTNQINEKSVSNRSKTKESGCSVRSTRQLPLRSKNIDLSEYFANIRINDLNIGDHQSSKLIEMRCAFCKNNQEPKEVYNYLKLCFFTG